MRRPIPLCCVVLSLAVPAACRRNAPEQVEARARIVASLMVQQEWGQLAARFSPDLRRRWPRTELAAMWRDLRKAGGSPQGITAVRVVPMPKGGRALVSLRTTDRTFTLTLSFDDAGKVSDLSVDPRPSSLVPPATGKPPPRPTAGPRTTGPRTTGPRGTGAATPAAPPRARSAPSPRAAPDGGTAAR